MEKIQSLKRNDFGKVYNKGRSKANKYLIMYVLEAGNDRLGISVSKKVGNSVVRHKVKRLIKEAYRLNKCHVKAGYDVVFIARNTAKDKTYDEIASALVHLLKMNKLYL